MQELWVCERCKSINRAQSPRCYSCGGGRPERAPVLQTATADGPLVTPGLDDAAFADAWEFRARNPYISTTWIGYGATALLAAYTGVLALIVMFAARSVAASAIFDGRIAVQESALEPIRLAGIAGGVLWVAGLVCHSFYLGLVNLDIPALGGGVPRYSPLRAGLFWVEAYLYCLIAQLSFWVPAALVLTAWYLGIMGVIGGVLWFVFAVKVFGDPVSWLTRPQRILRDLTDHLALPGADDGRIANYWAASWLVANGISMAVAAIVVVGAIIMTFANRASVLTVGGPVATASMASVQDFGAAVGALTAIVEVTASAITMGLSMWLTIVLGQRIRTREEWIAASAARAGRPA